MIFIFKRGVHSSQITSDEGRALHNINLAAYNGTSVEASGLNCFSPNVNLYRHPLWGRNQETYGEDTYLMSRSGLQYTLGLQVC
jgi:beta-glucosidase